VHSQDNTVGRYGLRTGRWEPAFVDVGNERNPWDVAVTADRLYVSNFAEPVVTVADRATGARLGELAVETVAAGGIAAVHDLVLIASSGFIGPDYGPAALVVLRRLEAAPWLEALGALPTSADNASDVVVDPARGRVYVVSAGARGFDLATGDSVVMSDGAVDVFDLDALRAGELDRATVTSVALQRDPANPFAGAPRTLVIAPGGDVAYLPSASSSHLYKLDLDRLTWLHDTTSPIIPYLGTGNQLTAIAMRPDGLAYVTAFNQDRVVLFDTACDASIAGPWDVGNSSLLEGPLEVAYDPVARQALVILSVSSAVSRVVGPAAAAGGP